MKKILFTILIFACVTADAQYKKPYFNTLNVASGLPDGNVDASLVDKFGYIWMGTQNGLIRYNGYKIKPYPMTDRDGNEIIICSVLNLYEDSEGKLWANIKNEGLYYLDRTRDLFIKQRWKDGATDSVFNQTTNIFYWNKDKKPQAYWIGVQSAGKIRNKLLYFNSIQNTLEEFSADKKGKNYIRSNYTIDVRKDALGKTWLVTDSLLSYFDDKSKSFKPWFVLPENPNGNLFESFQPDPVDADILWMNTYNLDYSGSQQEIPYDMKVIQLNTKTKKYNNFLPNSVLTNALPANGLQIYVDSLKRIWITTKKGISLFNRQNNTFTDYTLPSPFLGGYCEIASDANGDLWLSGSNQIYKELFYLNTKSGEVTSYMGKGDKGDLGTLNGINKIFFDKSGTFWVSTPYFGISYLDRQKSLFTAIPVTPTSLPAPEETKPSTFYLAGNQGDSICFISDAASLYAWHSGTNKYDKIDLKNKNLLENIIEVVPGKDGTLWIIGMGMGLFNYDPISKSTTTYTENTNDRTSLSSNRINRLAVDKEGIVWIGTGDRGLSSFNKQTGEFKQYPYIVNDGTKKATNALDHRAVFSLYFDADGILWIGTSSGGLNRFDTKTKKFTSFLDLKKGFYSITTIYEDSQKRLWAGSDLSGLFIFDRKTETFKRFSEKEGLLASVSVNIKEDTAGNIWTFNERGMSRLNLGNNTITNFSEYADRGLFSSFKDGEGIFHFFTQNGRVNFNPLQLNENRIPPSVVIESVSYKAADSKVDGDTTLFTDGRQKITMAYNENKISFQFVALHFANSSQNKYAYQLEGYDKEWVQAGTQHTANYSNLTAGTYEFKVKAANSDGVWNETGASITIVILPPWWNTWWAYCIYSILILGSIWFYIQYRSKSLRRENLLLEEKVSLRTEQLQQSIIDLKATQTQLIQSEKMASLGELTAGIAHEIQNPLNFVNNFSEVSNELIDEVLEERSKEKGKRDEGLESELLSDIKQNLQKINYHGQRAADIVKGMLQHSRSSTGKKEPTDINALCDEYLRLSYHGLRAKDKSFNATMKTDFDETIGNINIIPQDIGRVVLNLLTNAFYAVNEKSKTQSQKSETTYSPTVSISTKKVDDKVEIKVTDNGNGISQAFIDKIFQPFFTTKPTGQGTGLGLSLSYDIVKAHGGELMVESKEGHGTTFTIILHIN